MAPAEPPYVIVDVNLAYVPHDVTSAATSIGKLLLLGHWPGMVKPTGPVGRMLALLKAVLGKLAVMMSLPPGL